MSKEAMKLALEYLERRELAWNVQIALREALAEQQQEPVGKKTRIGLVTSAGWDSLPVGTEFYTTPPAQPQPFEIEWPEYNEHAMGCGLEDIDVYCRYRAMRYGWDCAIEAVKQAIPDSIYTSPPAQRVGLTNKKIDCIQQEWIAKGMSGSRSFARAIEAAHGIKENT